MSPAQHIHHGPFGATCGRGLLPGEDTCGEKGDRAAVSEGGWSPAGYRHLWGRRTAVCASESSPEGGRRCPAFLRTAWLSGCVRLSWTLVPASASDSGRGVRTGGKGKGKGWHSQTPATPDAAAAATSLHRPGIPPPWSSPLCDPAPPRPLTLPSPAPRLLPGSSPLPIPRIRSAIRPAPLRPARYLPVLWPPRSSPRRGLPCARPSRPSPEVHPHCQLLRPYSALGPVPPATAVPQT